MGKLATWLVLALVGLAGCTGGRQPASADPVAAEGPAGEAFYQPPPPPPGAQPGDLIWSRRLDSPAGTEGYAIMYWSTATDGELVAVSGVLFRPAGQGGDAPGRTIVAWAEGTSGMADDCAPSHAYLRGEGPAWPIAQQTLELGGVFVASDYQGLGTPGEHPYIAQRSAGRNVLDSIRAAASFAAAGPEPVAVVLGRSQGGGAALFAAELHASYAPEIALRGVVAVAPPSNLDDLDQQLDGGAYFGYVLMSVAGLAEAYPELAPELGDLTPAGESAVRQVLTMCGDEILSAYAMHTEDQYGTAAVLRSPRFSQAVRENDPGQLDTEVPILIVHGARDDTIPVANSRELVEHYCRNDVPVSAEFYPDNGHVDVLPAALPEIVTYLQDRLAGVPAPSTCAAG